MLEKTRLFCVVHCHYLVLLHQRVLDLVQEPLKRNIRKEWLLCKSSVSYVKWCLMWIWLLAYMPVNAKCIINTSAGVQLKPPHIFQVLNVHCSELPYCSTALISCVLYCHMCHIRPLRNMAEAFASLWFLVVWIKTHICRNLKWCSSGFGRLRLKVCWFLELKLSISSILISKIFKDAWGKKRKISGSVYVLE